MHTHTHRIEFVNTQLIEKQLLLSSCLSFILLCIHITQWVSWEILDIWFSLSCSDVNSLALYGFSPSNNTALTAPLFHSGKETISWFIYFWLTELSVMRQRDWVLQNITKKRFVCLFSGQILEQITLMSHFVWWTAQKVLWVSISLINDLSVTE